MKKLLLTCVAVAVAMASFAGNSYKLDDDVVDQLFEQAEEITILAGAEELINFNVMDLNHINADQTRGGFLIRSFFCGGFALHRSYMGTGGKKLWPLYLCVPVAGGIANCGDFIFVFLKKDAALNKYKDNSKWFVWSGN